MAGFVLIHGAFHTGDCFDPVTRILEERGHAVAAPTLPGMGGSEEEMRAATLDRWAAFAISHCRSLRAATGGPVILAGHSRGGLVLSAAAEADPQAADHLAYICALLTPPGDAREKLAALMPPRPELQAASQRVAGGAGMFIDPDVSLPYFGQLCPAELLDHAKAHLVPEPIGPLATGATVTEGSWGQVPRTYIECLQDRTMPITNQRAMVELVPGTPVVTLDSDHSPFYCMPEALADALEALAR